MHILVTGFEPFGGQSLNPSWEVCTRLPRTVAGLRVEVARIPCEFRRSIEKAGQQQQGATIFGYYTATPEIYGVVEFDASGKAIIESELSRAELIALIEAKGFSAK